jgi:hypothetical protein
VDFGACAQDVAAVAVQDFEAAGTAGAVEMPCAALVPQCQLHVLQQAAQMLLAALKTHL